MSWFLETPLIQHPLAGLDANLWLKLENKQSSGSFKVRGMSTLVAHHLGLGVRQFLGSSGGNAGYSLAYVCREAGAEATIVVPESTPEKMRQKILDLGAEVQVYGTVWDEAHQRALTLAGEKGAAYVHPFDDPLLWEGHAALIDECAQEMPEPDWILVAVGGGGLLSGVMQGMQRNGWNQARILACETEGAASFHEALKAGRVVTLDRINTIAGTLGAKAVAQHALDQSLSGSVETALFSDAEAVQACRAFYRDFQEVVEPSCGAALAPIYQNHPTLHAAQSILGIVCGGVGWDAKDLAGYGLS